MYTQLIADMLKKNDISYALLDEDEGEIRILLSEVEKNDIYKILKSAGWKKIKDKTKDKYLYGMGHFEYYLLNGVQLTICYQMACRSTLNNGWVPLDRMINDQALSRTRIDKGICCLQTEDEVCYLLAKCVYTNKCFKAEDIERIEKCIAVANRKKLLQKLDKVFFKFADKLLQLIEDKEYHGIIDKLWCFAEY